MSNNHNYKNRDFKVKQINLLEEIKNIINDINQEINKFSKEFNNYIKNLGQNYKILITSVDNLIYYIQYKEFSTNLKNLKSKQKFIKEICDKYTDYDKSLFIIYENNYINKIKDLNKELNNKINTDIPEPTFDPSNIGSFIDFDPNINKNTNDSSKKENSQSQSIIEDYKNFYKIEDNNILNSNKEIVINNIDCNCSICGTNKAFCFCEKCNQLFCKCCFNIP